MPATTAWVARGREALPYRFIAQARDGLRDIAAYARERWGDTQCDRYLTWLEWRCLQLAQEP